MLKFICLKTTVNVETRLKYYITDTAAKTPN